MALTPRHYPKFKDSLTIISGHRGRQERDEKHQVQSEKVGLLEPPLIGLREHPGEGLADNLGLFHGVFKSNCRISLSR